MIVACHSSEADVSPCDYDICKLSSRGRRPASQYQARSHNNTYINIRALALPTRRLPRSADCSICPLHEASSPSRPAFIRRTLQLAARSICTVGLRLACGQFGTPRSGADCRAPPPPPPPPVNLQTAPNAAGNPRAEGEPARVRIPHPSSMEVASHPPSGSPSWLLARLDGRRRQGRPVRLDGRRRQGRPVRLDGRRGQGGRSSGDASWTGAIGRK
ncbi:hypothetical protein PVAP13_9KG653301 [Panicum virgatum]|uniref:Uncharacterized protein n=1 Tax=Panicum virgatum TaxID=38727 RepID=A0A8T0P0V6_PANVG|nr:hypothetical protein PVAP13_9KG653301 [Panicum virgatum]KAG2554314.1 hypothetical protein PVAP13_9KG653301 [Panicum virgatum]KAG2554315.1 hypothetical protein PVAP13_9KG653301 [Panicum virgatum]KAG2554316.1 hypothetical protein PVAP13_9KG653301 [Panicum virgatum]KAG2554319.1 hypothetical protein PVAP13_9KG653301 [Panicum virgatum]